jgi:hypothetical protein
MRQINIFDFYILCNFKDFKLILDITHNINVISHDNTGNI